MYKKFLLLSALLILAFSALLYLEKHHLNRLLEQTKLEIQEAQAKNNEADVSLNMEVFKLIKEKQQLLSHKIGAVILH